MSLGGEHRKTRVSEYFQPTHKLPARRGGTMPGAQISGGGGRQGRGSYGVGTLQGNWFEEKFDSKNTEAKASLPTELEQSWVTSKRNMEMECNKQGGHSSASEAQLVGSVDAQLSQTTISILAQYGGDEDVKRSDMKQGTLRQRDLVNVVDGRHRAFPGHQPECDLETRKIGLEAAQRSLMSTEIRDQFINPVDKATNKQTDVADAFTGPARDKTGFVVFKIRECMKNRNAKNNLNASVSVYPTHASRSKRDAGSSLTNAAAAAADEGAPVSVSENFSYSGLRRTLAEAESKSAIASSKRSDGMVNIEELRTGFGNYGITLSADEHVNLFKSFDRDGTGEVDLNKVVTGIRGSMNDRRRAIVEKSFKLLETAIARKKGVAPGKPVAVYMEDILNFFDATSHPQVLSGEKTEQFVKKHLFEDYYALLPSKRRQFDDAIVTKEMFIGWYEDWSGLVSADHWFEHAVRNTWHVSGGEGLAQNTSCRHVEVIHTNGRITKEEIIDDLGIGSQDLDLMQANLERQGIKDVKRINFL